MEWNGTAVMIMERLERTDRYRYINRNDRGPGPERPRTGTGTTVDR